MERRWRAVIFEWGPVGVAAAAVVVWAWGVGTLVRLVDTTIAITVIK